MYNIPAENIFLRDSDGGVVLFDPTALQTRLAAAFRAAGQEDDSQIAGDMVIALEYTLRRTVGRELVFSAGEIDAALIRILESAGFPEAARIFRSGSACEQHVLLSACEVSLNDFLLTRLACSAERTGRIAGKTAEALRRLEIEAASPHLILELARHYERELAEVDLQENAARQLPLSGKPVLTAAEIAAILPDAPAELVNCGVLQIDGVSTLFPGIRFRFYLEKFAELRNLSGAVTELELYPELYQAAAALEAARQTITRQLAQEEAPPCLMEIPDMFDFLVRHLGSSKMDAMAAELAGVLCSGLQSEIYRLSFD